MTLAAALPFRRPRPGRWFAGAAWGVRPRAWPRNGGARLVWGGTWMQSADTSGAVVRDEITALVVVVPPVQQVPHRLDLVSTAAWAWIDQPDWRWIAASYGRRRALARRAARHRRRWWPRTGGAIGGRALKSPLGGFGVDRGGVLQHPQGQPVHHHQGAASPDGRRLPHHRRPRPARRRVPPSLSHARVVARTMPTRFRDPAARGASS